MLHIEGTALLEITLDNSTKILGHEGGTGSSKTVSLAQAHIIWSFQESGKKYSVVRKTLPALRRGALEDFNTALALMKATHLFKWNERDMAFTNRKTKTRIEFFSLDDPQKARGPRRDRLYCNEANELTLEDWKQLTKRTRGGITFDYNPSMLRHWLYTEVLTRPDCRVIHSTYLDNPYLTASNIREIEIDVPVYRLATGATFTDWQLIAEGGEAGAMAEALVGAELLTGDSFRWAVYGLGRRGASAQAVYKGLYDSAGLTPGRTKSLGLDIGWMHPTVLLDMEYRDAPPPPLGQRPARAELHIDELINESYITTTDIISRLPALGVRKRLDKIHCDSARPDVIDELKAAGYLAVPALKGPGSVKGGIDKLKTVRLCFTRRSERSRQQFQDYRYKLGTDGKPTEEPIKSDDDAPDAGRYGGAPLIRDRRQAHRKPARPAVIT